MFVLNLPAFNIFMTGDSHICSKIYPETVGDILVEADPEINFSYWGKVGARFDTFNDNPDFMEKIYEAEPDILIVNLGGNDSYSKEFNKERFLKYLTTFYNNVLDHFPNCKIVFVTPCYNFFKDKTLNENPRLCADAYLEFEETHPNVYVIDHNATHGMYFIDGGEELIRSDGVHYTAKGYEEMGEQIGSALLEIEDLWWIEEPAYMGD